MTDPIRLRSRQTMNASMGQNARDITAGAPSVKSEIRTSPELLCSDPTNRAEEQPYWHRWITVVLRLSAAPRHGPEVGNSKSCGFNGFRFPTSGIVYCILYTVIRPANPAPLAATDVSKHSKTHERSPRPFRPAAAWPGGKNRNGGRRFKQDHTVLIDSAREAATQPPGKPSRGVPRSHRDAASTASGRRSLPRSAGPS